MVNICVIYINNIISSLSAQSILNLVVFCIIVAIIAIVCVMFTLWKKGKYSAKGDFFRKLDLSLSQIIPACKAKLITNPAKAEMAFFWTVITLGIVDAVFGLVINALNSTFTIDFLLSLFFVCLLAFMMAIDYKLAPRYPYYYDYNPSLFMYSVLAMVFAFVNFVSAIASGYWVSLLLGSLRFVGEVFFYGLFILRRFFKKEFKPLDLLIYIGAFLICAVSIASFALAVKAMTPLLLAYYIISTLYSVCVVVVVAYIYDKFDFIKKLFKK